MTPVTMDAFGLDKQHILPVYKRADILFVRGDGVRLFDDAGKAYIDFVSGMGVSALGHGHAKLAKAVADQAATLIHTSNLFHHPLQGELASRLAKHSGLERAFFCNSGTEAIEACLKFARRYWVRDGKPARSKFVALNHAFHGRTFGSLSVTQEPSYREQFAPLVPGVTFVDPADPASIKAAIDKDTAAVIVEGIQGEGGVRPLSPEFVEALNEALDRTDALLIADEIQCGMGRTGEMFHSLTLGLKPDLMALGKVLGAGVPVGAALFSEEVASKAAPGDHGSTYGGNLLACRAALTVLDELEGGLLEHVANVGAYFGDALADLARKHDAVHNVRGAGLMRGLPIETGEETAIKVHAAALERGLLVNRTAKTVIRLLPPFIVTREEIDEAIAILDEAFSAASPKKTEKTEKK